MLGLQGFGSVVDASGFCAASMSSVAGGACASPIVVGSGMEACNIRCTEDRTSSANEASERVQISAAMRSTMGYLCEMRMKPRVDSRGACLSSSCINSLCTMSGGSCWSLSSDASRCRAISSTLD